MLLPTGTGATCSSDRPALPIIFSLTYVPKDASGAPTGPAAAALSRPRVNGVPSAQYAKDRFRDDYSLPS